MATESSLAKTPLAQSGAMSAMAEWTVMKDQATMLVKTGFLPESIKTAEQALAIMMTGKELGIPPMQALRGVNVIHGTPTVKPELMLALCVQRVPGFVYQFENCSATSATFTAQRPGMAKPHSETFTIDDAKRAGLDKEGGMYRKYPANMLRWRAAGNCLHVVAPDVLVGIYTPEELGAEVTEAGEIVILPEPQVAQAADLMTNEQVETIKALLKAKFETPAGKMKQVMSFVLEDHAPAQGKDMTQEQADVVIDYLRGLEDYTEEATVSEAEEEASA